MIIVSELHFDIFGIQVQITWVPKAQSSHGKLALEWALRSVVRDYERRVHTKCVNISQYEQWYPQNIQPSWHQTAQYNEHLKEISSYPLIGSHSALAVSRFSRIKHSPVHQPVQHCCLPVTKNTNTNMNKYEYKPSTTFSHLLNLNF